MDKKTLAKKQKHYDKTLKALTELLVEAKMSIVAIPTKDGKVTLRLVEHEDMDKYEKAVEENIKKQIQEQIETISGKGDKIRKPKVHI